MQRNESLTSLLSKLGSGGLQDISETEILGPPPALTRQRADNYVALDSVLDAIQALQRQVNNQQMLLTKIVRITQANNHCVRDLHHAAKIKQQKKQLREQADFRQTTGYELGDYSPTHPGY